MHRSCGHLIEPTQKRRNHRVSNLYEQQLNRINHLSCSMAKPTKWLVCPAKTQNSLGICTVWSESSLSAWKNIVSLASHGGHIEDSDQTALMRRLILVFAGCTCHFVGFDLLRLIWLRLKLPLVPDIVIREGSDEIPLMHRLAWAFAISFSWAGLYLYYHSWK